MDGLIGIPNESAINILKNELKDKAVIYFLIGTHNHDDVKLNKLIDGSSNLTYNQIAEYIYYKNEIESSYFDNDGILTFNLIIPTENNFKDFNYAVVVATKENEILATIPTPKIQLLKGIGGSQVVKLGISGEPGQMNFKATDYLTMNEADEILLGVEIANLEFTFVIAHEMIKDKFKEVKNDN